MEETRPSPSSSPPATPRPSLDAFARAGSRKKIASTSQSLPRPQPRLHGIRRLRADDARLVRAGQALGNVCAVAKELLENALDAGATRVEVVLRGAGGTGGITVSDDGRGVDEADFATLCLPGATSKRTGMHLTTFGFRGSALAAVCATCARVVVVTRSRTASQAHEIQYDARGKVVKHSTAARPCGTTVSAESVFSMLPVRRIHAEKHAAREIAKVVNMVQAYTLIACGTRIELRVDGDSKLRFVPRSRRPSTVQDGEEGPVAPGDVDMEALRHSVSTVLGRRVLDGLVEFRAQRIEVGAGLFGKAKRVLAATSVTGFISSGAGGSAKGTGRGGPASHQFIFINRRPVDMARLVRAANETFRRATGNPASSPVFILNLSMPPEYVDVNLAPDKRAVMCEQEVAIVARIAARLEEIWAPTETTQIPAQHIDLNKMLRSQGHTPAVKGQIGISCEDSAEVDSEDAIKRIDNARGESENVVMTDSECKADTEDEAEQDADGAGDAAASSIGPTDRRSLLAKPAGADEMEYFVETSLMVTPRKRPRVTESQLSPGSAKRLLLRDEDLLGRDVTESPVQNSPRSHKNNSTPERRLGKLDSLCRGQKIQSKLDFARSFSEKKLSSTGDVTAFLANRRAQRTLRLAPTSPSPNREGRRLSLDMPPRCEPVEVVSGISSDDKHESVAVLDNNHKPKEQGLAAGDTGDIKVNVDWDAILGDVLSSQPAELEQSVPRSDQVTVPDSSAFKHASMASMAYVNPVLADSESPQEQQAAEVELTKVFRQDWFTKLRVVGQFNVGFIVCQLGKELFIVDQHASDEKRNFEELYKESVTASTQRLVRPLALNLPAADELVVVERLADFAAGGYEIAHRPERPPTKRLFLHTQPAMRGRNAFVMDDIHEIIASVRHTSVRPGEPLRPPRERALIASRACRKSVMIGHFLDAGRMAAILKNLASLKHPWTCPHGRPTMRHLCTLDVQ